MAEINLLSSITRSKRSITEREDAKTQDHINISRMYGKEYLMVLESMDTEDINMMEDGLMLLKI